MAKVYHNTKGGNTDDHSNKKSGQFDSGDKDIELDESTLDEPLLDELMLDEADVLSSRIEGEVANRIEKVLTPGLYIVATPIGNLEDITLRAIRTLKQVDCIFCEDTRYTRKLLSHYGIKNRTESFHARSGLGRINHIVELLESGKTLAYVTDSGTPGVSDPSSLLVAEVRGRLPEVKIVAVPGPSALTAAVSIAGLPIHEFVFVGFLPHKKGRETLIKEIVQSERAFIFYESTHRIEKALHALKDHMLSDVGGERLILIGRELTKTFEEAVLLTPSEHLSRVENDTDKTRGEFVLIVPGVK